jgi:DegV family protein with EDD domain
MANVKFFMDSAGDLTQEYIRQHDISIIGQNYRIDNNEYLYDGNPDDTSNPSAKDFYERMRAGGVPTTSMVNPARFTEFFEPALDAGCDIFCVTLSSGLSGSYGCASAAAGALRDKYPERSIRVIDSLAATGGEGIVLYLIIEKCLAGWGGDAIEQFINAEKTRVVHWFTVDDLVYLKRGGRISPTTALIGSMLNLKPVLDVDGEGKLVSVDKAQGRKRALKSLVDHMAQDVSPDYKGPIFVSHADCEEDALMVEKLVAQKFGREMDMILPLSPIIGSHSGPGTVALVFFGDKPRR